MTCEEAIERLKQNKAAAEFYAGLTQSTQAVENEFKDIEALDMAIKALKAEPTGDTISRADAIDFVTKLIWNDGETWNDVQDRIVDGIKALPSADMRGGQE